MGVPEQQPLPASVGPLEFVTKQDDPGSANRNCARGLVGWTATPDGPDGEEPVCPAVTVSFHVFHKPLLVLEVER